MNVVIIVFSGSIYAEWQKFLRKKEPDQYDYCGLSTIGVFSMKELSLSSIYDSIFNGADSSCQPIADTTLHMYQGISPLLLG